jgi:hypothetical protein
MLYASQYQNQPQRPTALRYQAGDHNMRILSLDYDPVFGNNATRAAFSGDLSVFDYDMTIWDPANSFEIYVNHPNRSFIEPRERHYRGLPALSEYASVQIQADATRREAEFSELLNMGRVLVVIARPPQSCYADTGERKYSGTGRHPKITNIVKPFDLLSAIPGEDNELIRSGGQRVVIEGDAPLSTLLRKYKDFIRYTAVISKPAGNAIARVRGANRAIASVNRVTTGGYLILLPTFNFETESSDEETDEAEDEQWLPEAESFQYDLVSAIEQVTGIEGRSWPRWADRYLTTAQRQLRSDVIKQQKRVELARAKLAKLQRQTEESEAQNQLFLGTGRTLELEVKEVLELLGGVITEPEPGRDDWKVSFPEGDAVVEVKGVTKSAAEKQAAQLEKWVAIAFEETGKQPKGLLVVNTWRELPLEERTKKDFPDQMLPYCRGREHCLATGLQLLIIRSDVERHPGQAAFWRKEILQTSGLLKVKEDWRSVIEVEAAEAKESTDDNS